MGEIQNAYDLYLYRGNNMSDVDWYEGVSMGTAIEIILEENEAGFYTHYSLYGKDKDDWVVRKAKVSEVSKYFHRNPAYYKGA